MSGRQNQKAGRAKGNYAYILTKLAPMEKRMHGYILVLQQIYMKCLFTCLSQHNHASHQGEQTGTQRVHQQKTHSQKTGDHTFQQTGDHSYPLYDGEYPQQSGLMGYPQQSGVMRYPQQSGVMRYPQQSGGNGHPQQSGVMRCPQQSGGDGHPQQSGVTRYPQQSGGDGHPRSTAL